MFDDDAAVIGFLDAALRRGREYPDAAKRVDTLRFMRYPSQSVADTADVGGALDTPDRHPDGTSCPATPRLRRGTIVARLVGRRLDAAGAFVPDTRSQENYTEDRFTIPVDLQEDLAKQTGDRITLPEPLARLLATYAYLGELDVRPRADAKRCTFTATRTGDRLRIEGRTEASGSDPGRGDGASFRHDVALEWTGFIDVKEHRIVRLVLSARGTEHVVWKSPGFGDKNDVSRLPAGRPFSFTGPVRYGIVGEPVAEALAADRDESEGLPQKMDRLQAGVRRWQEQGRDPSPIGEIMRAFGPLMEAGKVREAEALLDQALKKLEE